MKVRLMIIIGVISFLLGGCNKIQKNSNQVQLVQRTEEILVESEDLQMIIFIYTKKDGIKAIEIH